MKNKLFIALFIVLILNSCAPKVHKTFGFDKLNSLEELNGTYHGTSSVSWRHHGEFNVLESFFIEDHKAESFTIKFLDKNTLKLEYEEKNGDENVKRELTITGKKVKNLFGIKLNKDVTLIPFIGGKRDVNLIRIGRNPQGKLIIENYIEQSKSVLAVNLEAGKFYNDVRVFEQVE